MNRWLCLSLLAATLAAQGPSQSAVAPPELPEFLDWYRGYQGSFAPPVVADAFLKHLSDAGVPAEEGKRRLSVVQQALRTMPREFISLHFDKVYTGKDRPFRNGHSEFLARVLEGRQPGQALDVAMGQGRNSLYLAARGWQVTGYDLSAQALAQANAAAKQAGLSIQTMRAAHQEFDYGVARWDLIVQTFAFTNLSDDAYRKRMLDSLKPGGLLVIEGFGGGGPKNLLFEAFREMRVLAYEDREETADWGLQKSRITRIAAERLP